MRAKRKIVLKICFFFLAIVAVAWLALHFIAPNPTHRWYSSQIPDELAYQSNVQNWRAAEIILAGDLGLPDNNLAENLQCFCNPRIGTPPDRCNSCTPIVGLSTYRIPDVVSESFIADSKYYQNSVLRVDEQLQDFALIAETTNRDLWIFVPIFEIGEEPYTSEAQNLVQSTGGDIISYFVVDGYESRLHFEMMINGLLIIIVLISLGAGVFVYIMNNRPGEPSEDAIDDIDKTEDSVNETEEFMKRMERLSKKSKDEDDKKGKK